MGFDASLKRFFPYVVCGLLGTVALLQATGVGRMVASTITEAPDIGPQPSARVPRSLLPGPEQDKPSARPILARNPFDSETGPLDGTVVGLPDGGLPLPDGGTKSTDPYDDPSCDFGRVVLISANEDPAWSFAAIEGGGGKAPTLRRTGDEIAGHTVHFVSWDRVWFVSGASRCQLKLGDKARGASGAPAGPATGDVATRPSTSGRTLDPALAAKIHKVSDTEFNIERSVVDEILEKQAELMRTARIVPEKDGDKVVGIRMFGIRKGTLLNVLGFQNSDRLVSINDYDISDPQKALEAYGRLRTVDHLKVSVVRNGAPMVIDFNIQ
jgi:general secretion pathway protein C